MFSVLTIFTVNRLSRITRMVSQLYSLFRKHIARQNAFSTSIAVAMSGGIDSSVTAYLLKQQGCRAEIYVIILTYSHLLGYDVVGVFMRNWDQLDEAGQANCTLDSDFQDMKKVCERLGIRYVEVGHIEIIICACSLSI
jgi:asparagine synthetase B (glutamine-hydrolysing)